MINNNINVRLMIDTISIVVFILIINGGSCDQDVSCD